MMGEARVNGYAVACTLSSNYKKFVSFSEFKRRVADQLSAPRQKRTEGRKRKTTVDQASMVPNSLSSHILSDNETRKDGKYHKDSECFLCEVMGKDNTGSEKKFSKMGCFQCGQCYHLQCFNRMHHRHLNSSNFNTAMDLAIRGAKTKRTRTNVVTDPANRR
jgi:hypothetical protein